MTVQSPTRKIKCSFTLSPEAIAFLRETRAHRHSESDSEALDLLLKDLRLAARKRDLEAAVKAYYDGATEDERREEREWAEGAGPGMWNGVAE